MNCFQNPFRMNGSSLKNPLIRRGSEPGSEGSGSGSIRYMDQLSAASSTDTLPGIKNDYLDNDILSPGPDCLASPTIVFTTTDDNKDEEGLILSKDSRNRSAVLSTSTGNNKIQCKRKLKLHLIPANSSSSINGLVNSSASPSPASEKSFSKKLQPSNTQWPSMRNGYSDDEDHNIMDDDMDDEDEKYSSLPSSPATPSTIGLVSEDGAPNLNVGTYYGFLSVNGGAMRQESTSTSTPQLNTESSRGSSETLTLTKDSEKASSTETVAMIPNHSSQLQPISAGGCLPAARSCPNLERQSNGFSSSGINGLLSPTPSPSPAGPRFKPIEEGDIQVCYLNHARTLVSKLLSSKFLRRWETHHLYLNDACLSSKSVSGSLQEPIPYSKMTEVYAVARWDPTYKYCLRIVLSDGSLLLQASNAYTRDQWYHSILWKKSIFKYQHMVSKSTKEEVILRELKALVDFALWTPLQDERVASTTLESVGKLLESKPSDSEREESEDAQSWAEAVLNVASPLLERVAPPVSLANVLSQLVQQYPRSQLIAALSPAITRCLKHTVDFGKTPHMKKLLQVYVSSLYENEDGENAIREYVASLHGSRSDCPHPRILPNLVSICVAAIFHRFEASKCLKEGEPTSLPPLRCYLLVLDIASEYADWRPGLGGLLQPVPFPKDALIDREYQESILLRVMRRIGNDRRCQVHTLLLPVRESRPGWLHIVAPTNAACPDQGEIFGEMLTTLLSCCCRTSEFINTLLKQTGTACILLAVRDCEAAQDALCLMLEWGSLDKEESRLQVVSALQSTDSGKAKYAELCQRQKNLQELQKKGGPRTLRLPSRATDADVALLLGGGALGNLERLNLSFTSVTSACAEQLIKLPALRHLNLWATQFGDQGLKMISEHLQKLQVLNLCETPVSDKGISTLASLTSLRKLNLNSTKLSAQTFESLKKRLPCLQEFDVRYTEAW